MPAPPDDWESRPTAPAVPNFLMRVRNQAWGRLPSRLLVAYRKVGHTIYELPLPFGGIEADCGNPQSGRSGSCRSHCREYPGGE